MPLPRRVVYKDGAGQRAPQVLVAEVDSLLEEVRGTFGVEGGLCDDAAERFVRERVLPPSRRDVAKHRPRHAPRARVAHDVGICRVRDELGVALLRTRIVRLSWRRPSKRLFERGEEGLT